MELSICCHCCQTLSDKDVCVYGLHENCFKECFGSCEDFVDLIARSQSAPPRLESQGRGNISFFHGAYRKYSARLGKTNYILKVQQKEYPELPATEFLSNQIFSSLNIPVPDHYLIKFPEDKLCFVTKNFISNLDSSTLDHIYHFVTDDKKYDCESLIEIIGEKTQRRREQEKFVLLTLADSLIGNHDRHGRNLAFIRSPKGIWLSPFYDNPSALALEDSSLLGADLQPRGAIFTKDSNKPTMKDYVWEWNRLGFNDIVQRFKKNLCLRTIKNLIQKSHLSEKRKQALLSLILKRIEEL
ncbi:MAG: HipA domain-containing protein [Parachlamydiales bacterium]|nr:HipA domain-containing protein [Parachlamydiales bacterium]